MILLIDNNTSIHEAVAKFADSVGRTVVKSMNMEHSLDLLKVNSEFQFLVVNAQKNEDAARHLIKSIGECEALAGLHVFAIGLEREQAGEEGEPVDVHIHYLEPPVMKENVSGFLNNVWARLLKHKEDGIIARVSLPSSARPLIAWKSEYSIGVESIDKQHKQLVTIINVLNNSTRQGSSREVLWEVLVSLIRYTKIHFESEERLFKMHGYPGYDEQRRAHEKLTAQVSDFSKAFIQHQIDISPDLMVFLRDWLMDHVLELDRRSRQFLRERGAR